MVTMIIMITIADSLGCAPSCDSIRYPGLKALRYVACDEIKLVGVLSKKKPQFLLLLVLAK